MSATVNLDVKREAREPSDLLGVVRRLARRRSVLGVIGILLALAVWQLVAVAIIGIGTLPDATSTLRRLGSLVGTGPFWSALEQTLVTAMIGFLASLPLALALGILTGMSSLAYHALRVVIEILKPIPPIVILPLVVLKAGSTERMAEILILFTVVPSLVVIVAAGVRDTDPVALDTARSFGLGRWSRVRRIVLPSAFPFIATGLRISIAGAVVTAVMAEIVAGAPGLGAQLNTARSAGDSTAAFAYVVALGALGIVLTFVLNRLERHALRWHVSMRADHLHRPGILRRRWQQMTMGALATGAVGRGSTLLDSIDRVWVRSTQRVRIARWERARTHTRRDRRTAPTRLSQRYRKLIYRAVEIIVPVGLVALWWIWSANAHNLYFPAASTIFRTLQQTWLFAHFTSDAVPSLENLFLGLFVGCGLGVAIGILMAEMPMLGDMLDPVIVFFRSIPGVAYVPIMILLIGFSAPMRIASIALASIFPVLIATVDGLRGVDSMMRQVGRAYALSWRRSLVSVRLPAAAPRIAAGAEVSIAVAVVVMVASELDGTVHGIGAQTILAQQSFDIPGMWAGILLLAFIGVAVNLVYRAVRLRLLRWYYEPRHSATLG